VFKNFLNTYFGFNKQQRNGIYVLCVLSLLLFIVRISYPYFIKTEPIEVAYLETAEAELDSVSKNRNHNTSGNKRSQNLFAFDPNTVSKEELLKLGFWERTANTFLKYRSKGAVFKKPEDLKKVYGISENFYNRLAPYIIIRNANKSVDVKSNFKNSGLKKQILELNSADSLQLIELRGVGPAYAKRILKYRSLLGGFHSINQLKEVYGMNDDLYELLQQQCAVNSSLVAKLNINSADFKTVNKHPYISYELCKLLFYHRKNGPISADKLNDIIQDSETTLKLLPYLEF
jgi:competence protein ComEA